jgi:Domain of unknown function (DUF4232)
MRITQLAAVTAASAALALTLTACGGGGVDDEKASASASSSRESTAVSDAPSASSTSSGAGTGTDTGTGIGAGSSTGTTGGSVSTSSKSGSGTRCHTSDLVTSIATGGDAAPSGTGQQHTYVLMHNKGTRACTLEGFPGVDLKSGSGAWSLARSSGKAERYTLTPGGPDVQFTITFLPWTKGSGEEFKPTSFVVTPPGETTSVTLRWPWGSVLRQDGATHPGTYVGPIGS